MKTFVHLAGPVLILIGTAFGGYGTFLMTRFYHPFGGIDFARRVLRVVGLAMTGQKQTLALLMSGTPQFASEENKAQSLTGIYILFVSFFIQAVGAGLTVLDVWIS